MELKYINLFYFLEIWILIIITHGGSACSGGGQAPGWDETNFFALVTDK